MEITGKLVSVKNMGLENAIGREATIKLPEVDVSKINKRDEVLVRCKLRDVKYSQTMVIAMAMRLDDVVYIFPQQPKPEEKSKVELPVKFEKAEGNYLWPKFGVVEEKIDAIIDYLKAKEGEK